MRWFINNFSAIYLIKVGIGLIICCMITRNLYIALGNYSKWSAPWKRILFISPILITFAFLIAVVIFIANNN
jgi:hypothetical protein